MAINTYAALSPDILLNPSPGCIILSGLKTLNSIISEIFANGEQGFAYDPNDLSTMYQDAAGTVPVTAVGQPVALSLDKSKGLVRGSELVVNGDFNTTSGWSLGAGFSIASGKLVSTGTTNNITSRTDLSASIGKRYEITVNISSYTSGTPRIGIGGNLVDLNKSVGISKYYVNAVASTSTLYIYAGLNGVGGTWEMDSISIKEIAGNHAYQTQSAMRPLLVASPQRLDYDTANDKLITNLPAQLTGCTVIRSVPNVGTQILTNQTIPTTYNDNTDHCGLIVINRALTATETSQITAIFNKAAGV